MKSKLGTINEVLEFDHVPAGEEIQIAIAGLAKYRSWMMQFLKTFVIKQLPG